MKRVVLVMVLVSLLPLVVSVPAEGSGLESVSYTHLTLPTN